MLMARAGNFDTGTHIWLWKYLNGQGAVPSIEHANHHRLHLFQKLQLLYHYRSSQLRMSISIGCAPPSM